MNQPYQIQFDSRALRDALGEFATGVAVVTACGIDGQPVGVTINSFASVSLEPPLVLWSLGLQSPSLAVFEACSHYAVNVLAADQVEWSQRFSQSQDDKFAGIATKSAPAARRSCPAAVPGSSAAARRAIPAATTSSWSAMSRTSAARKSRR